VRSRARTAGAARPKNSQARSLEAPVRYPDATVSSPGLLLWTAIVLVVAFAVPYVCADRLDLPRGAYVAVLTLASVGLWAEAVVWTGLSVSEVLSWHWLAGLVLAPVVALVPSAGITRMPVTRVRHGGQLAGALSWDAGIYGIAEGLLLSALPAFLAWNWVVALGLDGWVDTLARWAAPLAFSILVIVIHHVGYPEFRHPLGLAQASFACGILTLGYLITGSVWTPTLGHVLLHAAAVVKGNALPPHSTGARHTVTAP